MTDFGKDGILFRGRKRRVAVTHQRFTDQNKLVEPLVFFQDGKLGVGYDVFDIDESLIGRSAVVIDNKGTDVIAAYRTFLLLGEEQLLSDDVLFEDAASTLTGEIAEHDVQRTVAARIGSPWWKITRQVPENLVQALQYLHDAGATLDTAAISREIEAGVLDLNAGLEAFGVEHPREIKNREKRRQKAVEPYVAYAQEFLSLSGHPTHEGCGREVQILDTVYRGLRKGIKDDVQLIGYALAKYAVERHGMEAVVGGLISALKGSGVGFAEISVQKALGPVCAFLVKMFEVGKKPRDQKRPSEYLDLLCNMNKTWDSLPETTEV